jgi:hypothetical protein
LPASAGTAINAKAKSAAPAAVLYLMLMSVHLSG